MIVRNNEEILIIERKKYPFGFACPAGHIEEGENALEAAKRELREEVGLEAKNLTILLERKKENRCRRDGGTFHNWTVFEVEASGKITESPDETKSVTWVSASELQKLSDRTSRYISGQIDEDSWIKSPGLEEVWDQFFKELKIL